MVTRMTPGSHHLSKSPDAETEADSSDSGYLTLTSNWENDLRDTRFGPFEVVGITGSTNDDLVARVAGPADDGLVLVADHQSAGRGRMDRRWEAPAGTNLTFSALLRPAWLVAAGGDTCPDRRGLITSALAVSVVKVLETLGLNAAVKWPNDVVLIPSGDDDVRAGKIAGILAELVTSERPAIVVGLGFNVGWPPLGPSTSDEPVLPGATSLVRAGIRADRWQLLVDVLGAFDSQLNALEALDGPERLRRGHLTVSATVGSRVRVERPRGDLVGKAVDLTVNGALVVLPDRGGFQVKVHSGDITHLHAG